MGKEQTGDREQATGNRRWAMRRGGDIAERLLNIAARAIQLAERLPKDRAGRHVALQLVRCATSGGANYEEARAAESRDDFVHKARIAAKEMRETVFWLALIERSGWARSDLAAIIGEAGELAAILGASARTARRNAR
jgi:four helix bundle protein